MSPAFGDSNSMSLEGSNSIGGSQANLYTVPKLSADGSNWITYKERILTVAKARGLRRNFAGTARPPPASLSLIQPSAPAAAAVAGAAAGSPQAAALAAQAALAALTPEEYDKKVEEIEDKIDAYEKAEAIARQLIYSTITDALLLQVQNMATTAAIWAEVEREHQDKSEMYSSSLRTRLGQAKCEDGADVRAHLDLLSKMRAELASMGAPVADADFKAIIIQSLPATYAGLLTALTASGRLTKTTVLSKDVILAVQEEFDRLGGSQAVATALAAKANSANQQRNARGRSSGGGGQNSGSSAGSDIECFNCHRKGHTRAECWSKGGGREGQRPNRGRGGGRRGGGQRGGGGGNANAAAAGDTYAFTTSVPTAMLMRTSDTPANKITDIFDSGANRHLTPYRDTFISFTPTDPHPISAADSRTFLAHGHGDVQISLPNGTSTTPVILRDVLYAPDLAFTLVSISKIDLAGCSSLFEDGHCAIIVRAENRKVIGRIPSWNGLYRAQRDIAALSPVIANAATPLSLPLMEVHRRFGHISPASIERIVREGKIEGVRLSDTIISPCDACVQAKITRAPIPKERASDLEKSFGARIHTDVWGPAQTETIGKRLYYTSFTDDATRWTEIYLLRQKSDTFAAYKRFEASLKTQHDTRIKALQSDRGGEYLSTEFLNHLAAQGTKSRLTVHDTPQQNGVAERLNRTLTELARAMLLGAGLPKFLWGEAISHATWVKNRAPTRALDGKTPFEKRYGEKPSMRDLHEFGCKVWVHIKDAGKLNAQAAEGRFVGYAGDSKDGYRIYWAAKRTVTVERNVKFVDAPIASVDVQLEGVPESGAQNVAPAPAATTPSPPRPPSPINPAAISTPLPTSEPSSDVEIEELLRPTSPTTRERKARTRRPSAYVRDLQQGTGSIDGRRATGRLPKGMRADNVSATVASMATVEDADDEDPPLDPYEVEAAELRSLEAAMIDAVNALSIQAGQEPQSLEAAMRSPDWPLWEAAIQKELGSIRSFETWELVDPPPNTNIVGSKFVFRIKRNADGSIASYKARLVAQGFSQIPGLDFTETFAPVAKLTSIRILLAMAARNDWEIEQMDVKSAYLNGTLDEKVYMRQPPGFAEPGQEHKVCALKRPIYGLKQAGRRWYIKFCSVLVSLGLVRCSVDHGIFYMRKDDSTLVLSVSVDDLGITGTKDLTGWFKKEISKHFDMTDLGPLRWILGIEVVRDRAKRTISLSQRAYIETIIARFNLEEAKPVVTPLEPGMTLSVLQCPSTPRQFEQMRDVPYREAIGSLMYAALGTRPDISYAVTTLSQFMQNPGRPHWEAAKRVFRYLKGTREEWLTFGEEEGILGYTDADWASSEHRHSISGYTFLVDGGAISWSSKKQPIVALSSTEAEYIAVTHATKEAMWLRAFFSEVYSPALTKAPSLLLCDNKSAIALAKDDAFHSRTKHIDIRYHFIREAIDNGLINLDYCPTEDMAADMFTKILPRVKVDYFSELVGLHAL